MVQLAVRLSWTDSDSGRINYVKSKRTIIRYCFQGGINPFEQCWGSGTWGFGQGSDFSFWLGSGVRSSILLLVFSSNDSQHPRCSSFFLRTAVSFSSTKSCRYSCLVIYSTSSCQAGLEILIRQNHKILRILQFSSFGAQCQKITPLLWLPMVFTSALPL
jgi:hypothetical protein